MHARGIQPASNVTVNDVEDYCATFEKKMGSFLQPRADLKDEEASKLGMKNEEDEVEKFVQVITGLGNNHLNFIQFWAFLFDNCFLVFK